VLRSCERLDQVVVTDRDLPASSTAAAAPSTPPVTPPTIAAKRTPVVALATSPLEAAATSAVEPAKYVFGAPPRSAPELQAYVARAGSLLVDLARCRFEVDRKDARAYRWLRAGLWLRWERAPASNRRGRSELDGPSPARCAELFKAAEAEQWDDLLSLSELSLVSYPLWLDLNRFSALALAGLGEGFLVACAHVQRETRALLARLPELAALAFSDGVPFAAPDTARWLLPIMESTAPSPDTGTLETSLRERLQTKEQAAIVEVERRLRTSDSLRTSFLLRVELANVLERAGQPQRAAQVYLGLERDIDTYQLDRWEPELALRVLHPLWKILSVREGAPRADVDRVSIRLSQLSPTALL
jgi:type VI secretion system protein VasJ